MHTAIKTTIAIIQNGSFFWENMFPHLMITDSIRIHSDQHTRRGNGGFCITAFRQGNEHGNDRISFRLREEFRVWYSE
jgi:hypothetical protein